MTTPSSKLDDLFQKAVVLHHGGKLSEAQAVYRELLAANPGHVDAMYLLGALLVQQKCFEEAMPLLKGAIALRADYADAHATLGEVLLARGELDDAIQCFLAAIDAKPTMQSARLNMGCALQQKSKFGEAMACFQTVLAANPQHVEAHFNLGNAFRQTGRLDEAIASYRQALALRPNYAPAVSNMAVALIACGRMDEAVAALRHAVELEPANSDLHSGLLFILHFHRDHTAESLGRELARWNERHARPLVSQIQPHANDRSPNRRLRIGYVSPDFRDHCQSFFTIPLLSHHDHAAFEIFCYSSVAKADAVTNRLRAHADTWRDVARLSDEQLAEQIHRDQIDILVDLTMHMGGNRMLLFARKPAPVQITWLAYPGSTGLETMDYRLTDPHLDPVDQTSTTAEKPLRLPETFWCYDSLTSEPAVNGLPAVDRRNITFGCFNNFCKVNDAVIRLWSQVLRVVPNSKLLMLAPEGTCRKTVADAFLQFAISPSRITFFKPMPRAEYLRLYHRVDVALDTIPYNGHTTSLDALWMGVPVVTLVGPTVVGRAGLSQLTNLGLTELIAKTPEEFVRVAAGLAGDLPRLAELRRTLRGRLERSPLMDAGRFARGVEGVYREAWRKWCGTGG